MEPITFITVIIARLIGDVQMPATDWIAFRYDVSRIMREVPAATGHKDAWLEISNGTTEWKGRSEPCAMFTLMNVPPSLVEVVRANLAELPARYGQDAIGIRYGMAELITP